MTKQVWDKRVWKVETERHGWVCMSLSRWDKWGHRRGLISSSLVFTPWRKRRRWRWGCVSTLVVNETSLCSFIFKWQREKEGEMRVCVYLRSGSDTVRCLKKCLREEGAQLQESKVTAEKEKEGGARHLSLALSVPYIERRWERQVGERRRGCRGAVVTDRRPRRKLGSQHAAGVAGQQAAVIRIISRTAACSSTHRQILIGKISWDELKESCALSYTVVMLSLVLLGNCRKYLNYGCVSVKPHLNRVCANQCTLISGADTR